MKVLTNWKLNKFYQRKEELHSIKFWNSLTGWNLEIQRWKWIMPICLLTSESNSGKKRKIKKRRGCHRCGKRRKRRRRRRRRIWGTGRSKIINCFLNFCQLSTHFLILYKQKALPKIVLTFFFFNKTIKTFSFLLQSPHRNLQSTKLHFQFT